jgi:hypothetical protein
MKKLLVFLITAVMGAASLYAQFGGGTGTASDPYRLYTKAHIEEIGDSLWANNVLTNRHLRLMNDITDSLRYPIGRINIHPFNGHFHGNGHNIALAIRFSSENSAYQICALFPYLASKAVLDSLNFTGYISPYTALVGNNYGEINACINNLDLNSELFHSIAGICYFNANIVKNCINNADFYLSGESSIGGICHSSSGSVSDCINNGNIIFPDHFVNYVGGICVSISGPAVYPPVSNYGIFNCVNNGSIYLERNATESSGYVAGICLEAIGNWSIVNCRNYGNITLPRASVCSGIFGYVEYYTAVNRKISNCANYGNIEVNDNYRGLGGIAGSAASIDIINCFNSGNIISNGNMVGGIISGNGSSSTLKNCMNIGRIEGGSAIIDTIFPNGPVNPIRNHNYYDKQRCLSKGINNEDIAGVAEGKLTAELTGTSPALQAMLGNGWSYAEGRYPIPLGLENDTRAQLFATPVYLYADSVQYDRVDSVRHDFTVSTNYNVTWGTTEGRVSFDNRYATLLSHGSDILVPNMEGHTNAIAINIIDTIHIPHDSITHIATVSANMGIRIYPNPAINELQIDNYQLQNRDRIEIYNMLGQRQLSITEPKSSIIDISFLSSGMYIIKIGKFVEKFVKQH